MSKTHRTGNVTWSWFASDKTFFITCQSGGEVAWELDGSLSADKLTWTITEITPNLGKNLLGTCTAGGTHVLVGGWAFSHVLPSLDDALRCANELAQELERFRSSRGAARREREEFERSG